MGKQYKHLDQSMRDRIKALIDDGYGVRKIGRTLGLPHSTVSRELRRNRYGDDGRTHTDKHHSHDPASAQHKAYVRRKYAKHQGKRIVENDELRSFIIEKLKVHFNPDEISGMMKADPALNFYASKTAIYDWLYSPRGQRYCQYLYSARYKPKPRKKSKTERAMISDRISIDERPAEAEFRFEPGHCEFDSVVSSKRSGSKHALAVVQERASRLVRARLVSNLKPEPYAQTISELVVDMKIVSLTTDNGIENKHHKAITKQTGVTVYFTDPYSSWQKGGVENANKMLRRYFPKGTDFSTISQTEVDRAVARINNKPRKSLGYKSSLQVAKEKGVLVASGALRG